MEITPDKRKIVGLVEQAHAGKLCLPEFQRDFIWTAEAVADLIRSILRGYYIGSLLLLRCDPQNPPFAPIYLRGAKGTYQEPRPEWLILDGQQRLTSLIYALIAPDLKLKDTTRRRFFVDLNLLIEDIDNDDIVFWRSDKDLDGLDDANVQYERRILPCTKLISSQEFLRWRDGIEDWLVKYDQELHTEFRTVWRPKWTSSVDRFLEFQVPLVELPAVIEGDIHSISRVCAIFEKLNSTGVELSVYDLLTARLYRTEIRLHDLWSEVCKKHHRLNTWSKGKAETNKFGVLVLRTMALLRGVEPKPAYLINLDPAGFAEDWRHAAAAIERALELLELIGPDGFGVFDQKWLGGFALIPVLAALRAEIENRSLGEVPRADLRQWYWCSVFLERYSSSVETKSVKDYREMKAYWAGGQPPVLFSEAQAYIGSNGYSVRNFASYASSVYSGIFCLLALNGARDWQHGESIHLQRLQDHHIFPKNHLKKHGITARIIVNSIINRTLISDETNRLISDSAPAAYIANPNAIPRETVAEVLDAHFLDAGTVQIMSYAGQAI